MSLPPWCFIMYHFQMLWKCSVKLNNIPFLKTYCMWVLKLHIFSMDAWMLYHVFLSFSPFSSPVAQDIFFNTFLLGLITLTFVFLWKFSFDVDCEMSRFYNEMYIKEFVHSFMNVLWRQMGERHLENYI